MALNAKSTKNAIHTAAMSVAGQFLSGSSPVSREHGQQVRRAPSNLSLTQFQFPVSPGKARNLTVLNKDHLSDDSAVMSHKDGNAAKLMALFRMENHDQSTPSSRQPAEVYKGSIKDLLQ